MKCESTTAAEINARPLQNLPVGGNHQVSCSMKHGEGASEFHEDGRLCDEWLWNLERGLFTRSQCNVIRRLVWRDMAAHTRGLDIGQLIRLDVSLSKTLPRKRWGLQKLAVSLGEFKGMAQFEQEFGDTIEKK